MKLTSDAKLWHRKWSTWLGAIAASAGGGLGAYAIAPERAQALVPDWALAILMALAIGAGALIPLATSLSQKALEK